MNTNYLKKQDKDQLLRHANELEKILTSLKVSTGRFFLSFCLLRNGERIVEWLNKILNGI